MPVFLDTAYVFALITDCTSFVSMQQQGLRHALTTDIHFRQAGFQVLMLET
jgi:predicted nucleic acid-binding protein